MPAHATDLDISAIFDSRVGRATALSLPDDQAGNVGRKETRPTYVLRSQSGNY